LWKAGNICGFWQKEEEGDMRQGWTEGMPPAWFSEAREARIKQNSSLPKERASAAKLSAPTLFAEAEETVHKCGQVYCQKVAKNFGQCVNFSAREIEHGRFRALFAGRFWPKMQSALSRRQSAISQNRKPTSKAFYHRGH